MLSVSFMVEQMRREWGGCAGNIAYNLRHIGGDPVVMATVGDDGDDYRERLAAFGIGIEAVRQVPGTYTAQAFIITDLDDNQITAFHPGAMMFSHQNRVGDVSDIGLGIVSPDGKEGMSSHADQFAAAGIPFVFDPGQGMPLFSGPELLAMIDKAQYVAVNDYEGRMLAERTGLSLAAIAERVDALVVTLGGEGSYIYTADKTLPIPAARPHAVLDPTGCGDAYRAGHPAWNRARLGLGAHRRPGVGARRAQDRLARRAESCSEQGGRGRAVSRHVRRSFVVMQRMAAAPPSGARGHVNSLPVQCYRWTRTCVHVLAGVATTLVVFPLVSDDRRRSIVKRWSVRLLRILAVELRVGGEIGARDGNVMIVANHISWLDIFVLNAAHPVRFVAKSELASGRSCRR